MLWGRCSWQGDPLWFFIPDLLNPVMLCLDVGLSLFFFFCFWCWVPSRVFRTRGSFQHLYVCFFYLLFSVWNRNSRSHYLAVRPSGLIFSFMSLTPPPSVFHLLISVCSLSGKGTRMNFTFKFIHGNFYFGYSIFTSRKLFFAL